MSGGDGAYDRGSDRADGRAEKPGEAEYEFRDISPGLFAAAEQAAAEGRMEAPPPDIEREIFRAQPSLYAERLRTHPEYFSYSLWSLLRQLPETGPPLLAFFDTDTVMLDPKGLGQLIAAFQGFTREETGHIEDERIPVFDILLADQFKVEFAQESGASQHASFRLKVLGVGGTGGRIARHSTSARFGPYDRSCQLQAPVRLRWSRYRKRSTGERLFTLKVLPAGVQGLYPVCADEPRYKPLGEPRDVPLSIIPQKGEKTTTVGWTLERGYRSNFECPVDLAGGGIAGLVSLQIESASDTRFEFSLLHDGDGGHLYGARMDAVLLQAAP